jgi:broad specificity phosphatase PhoE
MSIDSKLDDLYQFDYKYINIGKETEEEEGSHEKYKYTFLRHTESKFNKIGPIAGKDPQLTEEGIEDAKKITGHYNYALVSIMERTKETFKLSNIKADHIEYSSLCREQRDIRSNWLRDEKSVKESNLDFHFRIHQLKQYLQYLGQSYDRIIIITHHGVIKEITHKSLNNGESIGVNNFLT